MTAALAYKNDLCGSCGYQFQPDETKYLTKAKLIRCKGCAEKITPQLPQIVIEKSVRQVRHDLDFGKFNRFKVGAELRGNVLDWRAKQAGGE